MGAAAPAPRRASKSTSEETRGASSVLQRERRDVEILAHRDVDEAAYVAERSRDMALARRVLGEDQVAGTADEARAVARLELEDPRGEEDQLPPRRVVVILDVALRRLAEEHGSALEGLRRGPCVARHRN